MARAGGAFTLTGGLAASRNAGRTEAGAPRWMRVACAPPAAPLKSGLMVGGAGRIGGGPGTRDGVPPGKARDNRGEASAFPGVKAKLAAKGRLATTAVMRVSAIFGMSFDSCEKPGVLRASGVDRCGDDGESMRCEDSDIDQLR